MSAQTSTRALGARYAVAATWFSVIARPWVWVAGLTLVAFALRRYHLGAESLWFDETDLVQRAQQPLSTLAQGFTEAGENGPLYTVMLHFWLGAINAVPLVAKLGHLTFGHNEEALVRGISAVAGAAAIPLMYALARRVGGVALGVLSAALLTFNPFHIWYSQDAKMYSLLVLLALASSLLYLKAFDTNSARLWLAYVLVTWVMLTVHSMAGLVFLAQLAATPFIAQGAKRATQSEDSQPPVGTHPLGSSGPSDAPNPKSKIQNPKSRWVRWTWAVLLVVTPIFPILWLRAAALFAGTDVGGWYTPTGLGDILSTIFVTFAVNRADAPWEAISAITLCLLAVVGVGSWFVTTSRPKSKILILSLWLVPILVFWLVTLRLPLFQPRYLIMALPPYLIMASAGLLALRRLSVPLVAVATLLLAAPTAFALAGVNYSAQMQKEDWRGAVSYVQDHLRLRDVIVVYPGYMRTALDYYYRPGGPGQVPTVPVETVPSLLTQGFGDAELNDTLRRVVSCHERVWLITSPPRQQQEDPTNKVQQWFQYNWLTFDTREFNGVTVYGISFNGQPNCWFPNPDHFEPQSLEHGLDFLGYIYELRGKDGTQPDASYFPLTLYWRNHEKLTTDYDVRVTIKDPTGKAVVDQTLGPLSSYWPTSKWDPNIEVIDYRDLRLPGGLAPGNYTVSLQVFPRGHPDQPLKVQGGGTEITFKDPLHVVPWKP
ncbi:MAG: glycosyltransferase family 39 protein [Chloroflexia bacterium]